MARTQKGFAMSAQKIRTKAKNDVTFASYFEQLKHMAENSFLWKDLPNDIDPIFIEKSLFNYGMVAVFNDPIVGLVALPAMQSGGFDIYGMPKMIRAFSPRTGFSQLLKYSPALDITECVIIHNTNRDLNSALFKSTLAMYAERLTEMKRTEDVNIFAQRTPVTMVVPQGQVETYTNLLDRYQNFGQIVFGYQGLDVDAIKSIHTDAPWVADKVDDLFIKTWNEAVGFLGISNVGVSKRERVSQQEVNLSMGSSMTFRHVRQEPREWAIDRINKKWGTNVSLDFSEVFRNQELEVQEEEIKAYGDNLTTESEAKMVEAEAKVIEATKEEGVSND